MSIKGILCQPNLPKLLQCTDKHFAKKKLRKMQLVKCVAANLSLILNFQKVVWIRSGNSSFTPDTISKIKKTAAIIHRYLKMMCNYAWGMSDYKTTSLTEIVVGARL
jgi:hypothetical protein